MKVVLFCGGLGTRILWHLMRYYAHFGHNDFILCLGYRGDLVREYFLKYDEAMTNDTTLSNIGGPKSTVRLHTRDTEGWNITFVDTGLHSNIGQRLLRVRKYLDGETMFLTNYADGLSNLPLDGGPWRLPLDDLDTASGQRRPVKQTFAGIQGPWAWGFEQ